CTESTSPCPSSDYRRWLRTVRRPCSPSTYNAPPRPPSSCPRHSPLHARTRPDSSKSAGSGLLDRQTSPDPGGPPLIVAGGRRRFDARRAIG
ncbi:hypothetical protein PMAYCL1PPCAC_16000, partial [Pristionchus mayeri]